MNRGQEIRKRMDICMLLIEHESIDLTIQNQKGQTALDIAMTMEYPNQTIVNAVQLKHRLQRRQL